MPSDLQESYLNMTIAADKNHSLVNFLQRPIRIFSGQFTTSQTQSTSIYTGTFPDVLLQDPMYNEKIRGFVGLRANVEVTVQVNAQKFQQGRLRLQYLPYYKYLVNEQSLINDHLTGLVSSPGVDIDICGGSNPQSRVAQAKFVIPYVSPHAFINLITGFGTMGRINLFVYSPLLSGSSETPDCEVTIWAKFINPQLAFPTGANPIFTPSFRRHHAQVFGEAKEIASTGVISNTLGVVSETLRSASRLPVIGQYLAIPEWVTNKGAAIAKLFGWSKPTLPMDVKLRTTNCMANYNGKDSAHKLALSADNEIDTPSGIGGTDLDEMALSSIFKIPSFWQQFTWSTSDTTTDKILFVDPVTPLKYSAIPSTVNGVSMTPMGYVANTFGLWRGSLVYTFKIVKTGFHAGRLRVFFTPYESASNLVVGSAPVNEIEKNYQVVVDIEESDTFTFRVPYVSTKPWFNTTSYGGFVDQTLVQTGYVVVTVLNELRAVSTVSQSINILVEVSGGDDLTFSLPTAPEFLPGAPTPAPLRAVTERKHEAQVLGTGVEVSRNDAQMLYDPESISLINPDSNWSPESHCIGEKIASVRQLVKRANYIGSCVENRSNLKGATGDPNDDTNTLMVINPYGFNVANDVNGMDYISYFSHIYAFFRGGIRLKITGITQSADGPKVNSSAGTNIWYTKPTNFAQMFVRMLNTSSPLTTAIISKLRKFNTLSRTIARVGCSMLQFWFNPGSVNIHPVFADSSSTSYVSNNLEGVMEVEVPYYNSTHLTPTVSATSSSGGIFPISTSVLEGAYPMPMIIVGTVPINTDFPIFQTDPEDPIATSKMAMASNTTIHVYRSGADDFGFHYIMGIPTMFSQQSPDVGLFLP
nr:MAG: structural protein [Dicistroviridae sp.]